MRRKVFKLTFRYLVVMEHACVKELLDLMRDINRLTKHETDILRQILSIIDKEYTVNIIPIGRVLLLNEGMISGTFVTRIQSLLSCVRSKYGSIELSRRTSRGGEIIELHVDGHKIKGIINAPTSGLTDGYYVIIKSNEALKIIINDNKYRKYVDAATTLSKECRIDGYVLYLPDDYGRYICGLDVSKRVGVPVFWQKVIIDRGIEAAPINHWYTL